MFLLRPLLCTSARAAVSFFQPPALFSAAHSAPQAPFLSRLLPELVRHEQPPRAFVAFPDALSPACVSRNRPAAPALLE
jgi:hypothetical protein